MASLDVFAGPVAVYANGYYIRDEFMSAFIC